MNLKVPVQNSIMNKMMMDMCLMQMCSCVAPLNKRIVPS
jgi:hypothetical protein